MRDHDSQLLDLSPRAYFSDIDSMSVSIFFHQFACGKHSEADVHRDMYLHSVLHNMDLWG